jgi:hypothetical protein
MASNQRHIVLSIPAPNESVSIEVAWPSGKKQSFDQVTVNHRWLLVEGQAVIELP